MEKFDPYPKFSFWQKKWLLDIIEGMVKQPEKASFVRVRRGNDLEIAISVAKGDEELFSEEVCGALKTLVSVKTGLCPVLYLDKNPHPDAQKSIDAARSQI